jgi:hypothetical protein
MAVLSNIIPPSNVFTTANTKTIGGASLFGAGNLATLNVDITGDADNVTGVVAAANGGTGLSTPGSNGNVLTSNGTTWTSSTLPPGIPSGGIIIWSGSVASIPSGWFLCNGSNGTPDLRDRFVVGAGSTYAVAATGGSANAITVSHTHTFSATTNTVGNHTHGVPRVGNAGSGTHGFFGVYDRTAFDNVITTGAGAHDHSVSGTTASTGSSGTNANLPPYYALAYIMKA